MTKRKLNSIQALSLLLFIIDTPLTGMNLTHLLKNAGVDSYISVLFAALISIIFLFMFKYIYNFKPELSLGEKIKYLFGNKIGTIINIVLVLLVRIFAVIMYFVLTDFIISQFLPETPSKIIGIVFGVTIIYTTTKGIEIISRMGFILLFFSIFLFLVTLLGLFPNIDLSNLKPILEFGIQKPFFASFNLILINFVPIFTLLCIPKEQIVDNEKFNKYLILFYIISTIIMFFTIIGILGNMGTHLSIVYQYPEYAVLKRINLFNFLDRIENILSMQRIIKMFMMICIFTYFISNTLDKSNDKKYIVIITVITIFISSQIFRTNTHFNTFVTNYLPIFRILFLILIIIILITIKLKRNKQNLFLKY